MVPMHPIIIRSIGISLWVLAVGLMALSFWMRTKGGNPIAVVSTAVVVAGIGYWLQKAADKLPRR